MVLKKLLSHTNKVNDISLVEIYVYSQLFKILCIN